MNFSIVRIVQGALSSVSKKFVSPRLLHINEFPKVNQATNQHFSSFDWKKGFNIGTLAKFLFPKVPQLNHTCGLKIKGTLQLRCVGCYYVSRQGKLYVMCNRKPKHKQVQMYPKFKTRRILTFAHQKKKRDW